MSHQYPGPYQQGPAPYQPPRPPKKGMSSGATVAIVLGSVFGGLFLLLIIIAIAVGDSSPSSTANEKTTVASSKPTPKSDAKNEAQPVEKATQKPTTAPVKPAPKKPTEYPNGDYIVGEDIPAGTYETPGAEKGFFEVCMITTEPTGGDGIDQMKTANADERIIITLTKGDGLVSISGCEPLTRR